MAFGLNDLLVHRMPATGDEPWYLMQSYALLHFHTPSVAAIVNNPSLYHHFLSSRDDHSWDYLANGERMLQYLPGYAVLIMLPYLMAGRPGIVGLQAVLAALTAALLFAEATRLFSSRLVGGFAVFAYLGSIPALLYVGQVFPSVAAGSFVFCGFLLEMRILPQARGRRLICASVLLGGLIFLLPWLHIKYVLVALMLVSLAAYVLRRRLCRQSNEGADRGVWLAWSIVAAAFLLSIALIALYSHHYYGSWIPPDSPQPDASLSSQHLSVQRGLSLYQDMFLSRQSGLFPWAPLDLLALPGLLLLWRRNLHYGFAVTLVLFGLLGIFLASIATPDIYQGLAYPARFTVEAAPFFALCVTALLAVGISCLRRQFQREPHMAAVDHGLRDALGSAIDVRTARVLRRLSGSLGIAVVGWCLVLGVVNGYFAGASLLDLRMLYVSTAGPRLVEEFPQVFPTWWFDSFPESPGAVVYDRQIRFDSANTVYGATDTTLRTSWLDIPPGHFNATFTLPCVGAQRTATKGTDLRFVVERLEGGRTVQIAQRLETSGALCVKSSPTSTLSFESDGYQATRFCVVYPAPPSMNGAEIRYTYSSRPNSEQA
ncbi:MAG: hypothetical protein ACLQUY_05305 [Ktedonobacterales bacterium]